MPTQQQLTNAIRFLSIDGVQSANSGHPGMPLGMADIAEVLWNDFLIHNPQNPNWLNRDRFVISNGHGSMLHYALLHLTGYDLPITELKNFRQWHSKTPGHPEYGLTPGIETTTGPLGQGLANSVGMAIAAKNLAANFNQENYTLLSNTIYTFVGDGCLMEGISHEACSLAGTLKLDNLIVFYDDNGISIDGQVKDWFTDNTPERFRAYGWHVIENVDGHHRDSIKKAIEKAKLASQPTIICCKTTIGFGSPKFAGTAASHGSALGEEEIKATREKLNWSHPPFVIPDEIYQVFDAKEKGEQLEKNWQKLFHQYQQIHPELAKELTRRLNQVLPDNWLTTVKNLQTQIKAETQSEATRKSSLKCITAFAKSFPEFFGGSADLTGSNCTLWKEATPFSAENYQGNYLYYGVREFAMTAICNGISLFGGFIPFSGTFLTFTDYARNAVRMAALMKIKNIFVYTHDSIGLGEDGPTHQPIEHCSMLRLTPNLNVWRVADTMEAAIAWQHAIERHQGPSALLFSRQNLPPLNRSDETIQNIAKGGYILKDVAKPEIIIIATGSEVSLALEACEKNDKIRIVSMPCCEVFDSQDEQYREHVLPSHIKKRLAIEAAQGDYWYKYVGLDGRILGINHYGESAPASKLFVEFGFSVENIQNIVASF